MKAVHTEDVVGGRRDRFVLGVLEPGYELDPGSSKSPRLRHRLEKIGPYTMRTTRENVIFDRPFMLSAIDGTQPAGSYVVETVEELLQDLSFVAYRRVATIIYISLRRGSGMFPQAVSVSPSEIDAERCASLQGSLYHKKRYAK